jgi:tetratricopeptide (TPR) repeat protein
VIICPYKGLTPFTEADEKFFAGRDAEIKLATSLLYGSALSILYGESGVGKTSLIRAGMLPALRKEEHRVATVLFREWQTADFETNLRNEILKSLLISINRLRIASDARADTIEPDQLVKKFCEGLKLKDVDDLYALSLDRFIRECSAAFRGRIFFIFDQFEEYIYYHPLGGDGERFDAAFARSVNNRDVSASFLLSLREDGLGKLDRLRSRIPDLLGSVLKLDHLDHEGARRAVDRPLARYNEESDLKINADSLLTATLLEQSDVERLEMEEVTEPRNDNAAKSPSDFRYKALALQAVLTNLWEIEVAPLLGGNSSESGPIFLTLNGLRKLADHKENHETEVNFIVRTYFDQRLGHLTDLESEWAAEILRGLVRAGGHKRARSPEALAKEATLPKQEVEALLSKLSSDPINLLRKVGTKNIQYEMHHDVMAFAIMDWSNRQRQIIQAKQQQEKFSAAERLRQEKLERQQQKLAEADRLRDETLKRRQKLALMSGLVMVLAVVLAEVWREKRTSEHEMLQMQQNKLIDSSFGYLGAANRDFRPDLATLTTIDSVAEYRRNQLFVPQRAALALGLVNAVHKDHIEEPQGIKIEEIYRQVACVESADRQQQLVIKDAHTVELRTSDSRTKFFSVDGKKIIEMGFDQTGERFGIRGEGGEPVIRTVHDPQHFDRLIGVSLADALKIPDVAKAQKWFRSMPPDGWNKGYDDNINNQLITAISTLATKYSADDRLSLGISDNALTERVNAAYATLQSGNREESIRLLKEAFREVRVPIDEVNAKAVLAANLFARATKEPDKAAQETYLRVAVELDSALKPEIERFSKSEIEKSIGPSGEQAKIQTQVKDLMDQGNQFARNGNIDQAKQLYQKAISLDPKLKDRVNPETEWTKFAPAVLTNAQQRIDEGYERAGKGDIKGAIESFEGAIRLDPRQSSWLDPKTEAQKYVQPQNGASAPSITSGTPADPALPMAATPASPPP